MSRTVTGVVAMEGKTLRRSHDQGAGKQALHVVSAWAVEHRLVLAQGATEERSNEIPALPLLFQQCVLRGCLVTIDTMGTQTRMAEQTIDQKGNDALALPGHQGNQSDEGQATREYGILSDPELLAYLDPENRWKGLRGWHHASYAVHGTTHDTKIASFLLSFSSARMFATALRSH